MKRIFIRALTLAGLAAAVIGLSSCYAVGPPWGYDYDGGYHGGHGHGGHGGWHGGGHGHGGGWHGGGHGHGGHGHGHGGHW